MNMLQVLYVLKVADCRNVSRAAEQLFLSQSALSQQLRRLEEELGYPLFSRTNQGLRLTEAGEQFCREARPLTDSWYHFQQSVGRNGSAKRKLRIGMGSRVYSNGLFPHLVRFFDQQEDLDVAFVTEAGQDFLAALRAGELDVALDRLPPDSLMDKKADFLFSPLIREQQCILMSPEDPRSKLPALSFSDLQGCTMMSGLENSIEDRTLKDLCLESGISLNRVYRSDGMETVMSLVRVGKGVTLGPRSFADYYQVAAVPLQPTMEVALNFICLRQKSNHPGMRRLLEYLTALCFDRQSAFDVSCGS